MREKTQLFGSKQSQLAKLPPISLSRKRTGKNQWSKNEPILKPALNSLTGTNRQKSSVKFNFEITPKEIRLRDLENFIRKKNMQELDEAYQFKTRNLTELSLDGNHRLTLESENVSEYIKTFFERKKKFNQDLKYKQDKDFKEFCLTNRSSKQSGRHTKHSGKKNSIYVKKLKNNFYEKKLLSGLGLKDNDSNKFNIYSDKFVRNYNSEFSILTNRDNMNPKLNESYCIFVI